MSDLAPILIALWFVATISGAVVGSQREIGLLGGLLGGLLLAWIGVFLIILLSPVKAKDETDQGYLCPYCRESIKPDARVCKHCRMRVAKPRED